MTNQELEQIFAQGNGKSWQAGLRAVYEAGQASMKPKPDPLDHDANGKKGGSLPKKRK